MNQFFIGDVLRRRREELGLTQEALAYGIFGDPSAISRIENGKQSITYRKLLKLLEKLDLPGARYYALVDKKDLEILQLQAQINSCELCCNYNDGLEKVAVLEKFAPGDIFVQQFVLRAKAALGKNENNAIIPYSFEEQLDLLFSALHLTIPKININAIAQKLYSVEEVKIINQVALAYSDAGQFETAINIYRQLLRYVQDHFHTPPQSSSATILISYNYCRVLSFKEDFSRAISIGMLGLELSTKSRYFTYLGGLSFYIAYCLYRLGETDKSQHYFQKSYHAYSLTDDTINSALAQEALEELFSSSPQN